MSNNHLIVVVGPTGIGKTRLAIALARFFNSAVVSCDSRQFFKEMRIGTAVPTRDELAAAPHYFIQNKSITEPYSVGDYEREAIPLIEQLFETQNVQVVVGGSGLYVDAITQGMDHFPEIPFSIKEDIEKLHAHEGLTGLQSAFQRVDPEYYEKLSIENPQTLTNPQRLKRFIGVSQAGSLPYSAYINKKDNQRNFNIIKVGLQADREIMYERINQRVDAMLEEGLLAEAQKLFPYKDHNALQTVGYRELFSFFEGELDWEDAIEAIKRNTRRFAKRQLTWFKRDTNTLWFDYQTPVTDIIDQIKIKM